MTQSEFLKEMESLFELPPGSVTREKLLVDLPGWGSLTLLGLMGMADEELGVALSPKAVLKCGTVKDLLRLLEPQLTPDSGSAGVAEEPRSE